MCPYFLKSGSNSSTTKDSGGWCKLSNVSQSNSQINNYCTGDYKNAQTTTPILTNLKNELLLRNRIMVSV